MKKLFLISLIALVASCTKDKFVTTQVDNSCYPKEVGNILLNKCATAGCHNTQSAGNANGLDYSTWENMFKGGKNGSSAIPFAPNESSMLYFTNTDSTLGLIATPAMPYLKTPLSTSEYLILKNWITAGAPNCSGFINFSDNPNRKKVYVCMTGCDKVAVFDAETKVIMRYVTMSDTANNAAPHQVKITPDGKYWGVVFYSGQTLQLYSTADDGIVASINIGYGSWNTVSFTHDMTRAYAVDYGNSRVAVIDLTTLSFLGYQSGGTTPHGSYIVNGDSVLYLTQQFGNDIYRIKIPTYETDIVHLYDAAHPLIGSCDPHEFGFTPDESKYFVSCQTSNEVRVLRTSDDKVDTVFSVGAYPQEFAVSQRHPYAFVTCQNDATINPQNPGSVYIFNYQTNQVLGKLYTGKHPHGIAVDDDHDVVYVANKNDGGTSHHPSSCSGVNGNVSIIDMSTLQLLNVTLPDGSSFVYKNEVLPGPWYVAYRK